MHDVLSIGIPVLAILFGIMLNQKGIERLDGRIDRLDSGIDKLGGRFESRFSGVDARLDRMQADLSMFYKTRSPHREFRKVPKVITVPPLTF